MFNFDSRDLFRVYPGILALGLILGVLIFVDSLFHASDDLLHTSYFWATEGGTSTAPTPNEIGRVL